MATLDDIMEELTEQIENGLGKVKELTWEGDYYIVTVSNGTYTFKRKEDDTIDDIPRWGGD